MKCENPSEIGDAKGRASALAYIADACGCEGCTPADAGAVYVTVAPEALVVAGESAASRSPRDALVLGSFTTVAETGIACVTVRPVLLGVMKTASAPETIVSERVTNFFCRGSPESTT